MKILVTGGSGYIGKTFIRAYKKTFDIVAPTHEQTDFTDARAADKMFAEGKFDAVVHLAVAPSDKNSALDAENLVMFNNIQYLCLRYGVKKLIVAGDGADLGGPIADATEDMFGKRVPDGGYALGRYLITSLAKKDKITTVLRLFDVFGEGGGAQCPINRIVNAGARGKKQIVIDRDKTVSAVTVYDAARTISEFLKRDLPRGDYNLVSGDKISYLELAKSVKRWVRKDGGDIDIVVKNETPDGELSASNAKLLSVLPIHLTSIKNGVRNMYVDIKDV